MTKSEVIKDDNEDADVVKWVFQDGSVLEVKQEEYSVRPCLFRSGFSPCLYYIMTAEHQSLHGLQHN